MAVNADEENFISFLSKLEEDNTPLANRLHVERANLLRLQKQVLQLCQEKDRIKQQLDRSTKQLKIVKRKSGIIEEAPKLEYGQKKNLLGDLLDIYGLLGIQVCYSDKKNVLLKFTSTSYGLYRCTYQLELRVSEDKIEAEKYDLPPFIPVEKILRKKKYNSNDVCIVAKEISDYLYAYNVRYKDVNDIQDLYGDSILNGLQFSLARELISFKLMKYSCVLDCKLSYLDLLAVQPDEISVQCTDLDLRYSSQWLHQFQESSGMSLAKLKLPLAINSILQNLDAQQNISNEIGSTSEDNEST